MILPNLQDYNKTYRTFQWAFVRRHFSAHRMKRVNYAYEILDYQVEKGFGARPAIISQKIDGSVERCTFREAMVKTNQIASLLLKAGVNPGDRFAIYAPRSIDYALILYAAIKCGAIAVPLFEAFGPTAIEDRLNDCRAQWIYTTDHLRKNLSLRHLKSIRVVFTKKDLIQQDSSQGTREKKNKTVFGSYETPFIIHYTSGSTAKPKGVLLVNRSMIGHYVTASFVLDLHQNDRYWNTGDPGWVTGMVYNFFAPLLHGVACHILEGPFDPSQWIKFMKRHKITVWYSTPTAFRLLRYYGVPLNKKNLPYLRHIVSAGEPLNPSLIDWTMENLGIPIYDSWYMTENGHQLINNYRCLPIKKGSMGKPLPGIKAAIKDYRGKPCPPYKKGRLMIKTPWPGLMKAIWGNTRKFNAYFERGWYISGDTAYQDKDGYIWFQGRDDDMIKSGAERISPFEVESILVSHPSIAEAAVIGKPDPLYRNIVKAFIVLKKGRKETKALLRDIRRFVKENLAPHEAPREIDVVVSLPKTRSGKIMRRVLRAREAGEEEGDTSTMDTEMMQR